MNELTLEHLAPYLPYGLKIYQEDLRSHVKTHSWEMTTKSDLSTILKNQNKPILQPLINLNKFSAVCINSHSINNMIGENGMYGELTISYVKVNQQIDLELETDYERTHNYIEYSKILIIHQELLKAHYDIFGLIEKGLAIDINTINS